MTMWPFTKRKRYDWKKEHARLWAALVPPNGQASSVQGEIIRVSGKLTDQAFRNGNMNWDDDHIRMWRYIEQVITSDACFSPSETSRIRRNINAIIRDYECPNLNGDSSPYYFIAEKVVDWCMAHPTSMPHSEDPTLKR